MRITRTFFVLDGVRVHRLRDCDGVVCDLIDSGRLSSDS